MEPFYIRQPNGKVANYSKEQHTFISLNLADKDVGRSFVRPLEMFFQCAVAVKNTHGEKVYAKVMELANEQTTWTAKLMEVDDVSSACQPPN